MAEKNIKLVVEYEGTDYAGWQVQPEQRTVQGELERAVEKVTGQRVNVIGAGRTDAGVHALGQAASFQTTRRLLPDEIVNALSALLPPDVLVRHAEEVERDFHARRCARSRRYRYLMRLSPTALERNRCWVLPWPVRTGLMRKAAQGLLGESNFAPLSVVSDIENTQVDVREVLLTRRGPVLVFEIEANRFLRKMVRAIVGTLVEVGRGRFEADLIERVLRSDVPMPPYPMAPASGLYLVSVDYGA